MLLDLGDGCLGWKRYGCGIDVALVVAVAAVDRPLLPLLVALASSALPLLVLSDIERQGEAR